MTQALAGFNERGIVLATDGRATRFDPGGLPEIFQVKKLFPRDRYSAILSGGAGVSVPLSLSLREQLGRQRGFSEWDEMVEFAQSFLSRGYGRHLEKHGREAEGFRRIYFILAGYSQASPPPGFSLSLLGSEDNELPLKRIPVDKVVVMPRNLGMEMGLVKALGQGAPLDDLLSRSKEFLERMAGRKEEVGPPYYFATITSEGYKQISL
jgi:hypothetical protein